MVLFETFKELDIRIGRVIGAERVYDSDKLIKLSVDLGTETKTIVAGIGKAYAPENLINQEIAVIANLEPRVLMGIESQGMLLAANDNGPVLLRPEREVPPGSKIS